MIIPDPKNEKPSFSENKQWLLMAWRISGASSKLKVSEIMPLTLSFQTNDVSGVNPGNHSVQGMGTFTRSVDKQLIAKLYWLISVTVLLRASNIHRIEDGRSRLDKGVLNMVKVAPNEKKGGIPE
ncbi:hypothetical protein AYI68_g6608 [Smittium mucronatum]|uniref:Uncharacterized protein n=1 Tax=Smittium mucronatum TaxID=133383 RepID=A0A1R0GR15_9FUNG|nr:hypothetical protein AYI68_g6608 [Smittium mucronatum]